MAKLCAPCLTWLLVSSLASATGLRLPPNSGQHTTWSRRAACALPFALPLAATAGTPLSASRAFSVREYVLDLKAARRGLDELTPLLERLDSKGYEDARFLLRKPPVNGVRKARRPAYNPNLRSSPCCPGSTLILALVLTARRRPRFWSCSKAIRSGCLQKPKTVRLPKKP